MADKVKMIDPKDWQGRYCIQCTHAPYCTGAGVMKNACTGFEPSAIMLKDIFVIRRKNERV